VSKNLGLRRTCHVLCCPIRVGGECSGFLAAAAAVGEGREEEEEEGKENWAHA